MRWIARARHELARRPWLYWLVVVAIAGCAAAVAHTMTERVEAARDSWGETSRVVVATRPVQPADPLPGATELRTYPAAVIPDDAVAELPPDAVARQRVGTGEVVVEADIAVGVAPRSLVPAGWLAVAVTEHVPSSAAVGDHVVVAAGGVVLAEEALVVEADHQRVVVAVPAGAAPMIAAASSDAGGVSLLLVP